MNHKIPIKVLVKESGRLFIFFALGALLITSLQDFDLNNFMYRAVSLSTLFLFIFAINTLILHHFDQRRNVHTKRVWQKAYLIGYCLSLLFFIIHHFVIQFLHSRGLVKIPEDVKTFSGWRLFIFIAYANFVVYSFVFFIQNFIMQQYEKSRIQLELVQLKSSNAETTNQLLKQQIQPHFLFNALNTLKSLIKKQPDTAEDYLIRLSDFLRASFANKPSGLSTVTEELKICGNYMEMQKVRFGDSIHYKIEISESDEAMLKYLPTFSLQPLLENAIKHNIATVEDPLTIVVRRQEDKIVVSNNLQIKSSIETSTGNGLSNLKERYRILSGDEVVISTDNEEFTVSLKMLDNERSNY